MAAHRYWRLLISDSNGGDGTVIGELILAISTGGASVATGGTASASDVFAGSSANNAFDGTQSAANAWRSLARTTASGPNQWIQYDFGGTPRDIAEIRIYYPAAGTFALNLSPKNFALYYSDDALTWTRQRAWSEQTFTAGGTNTYDTTPVPSGSITNRQKVNFNNYRFIGAALPQTMFATISRSVGIPKMRNWTRPYNMTPFTGKFRLAGSTTVLGMPTARRVDLLEQKSGVIVDSRDTLADGAYAFEEIANGVYTLMGVDNSAEQNSVVYAHVTPVL